jgi:hypothetical protein
VPGKHQQPGRYQFRALLTETGEPSTGDRPGALSADIVATPRHLTEMINQRLQFGASGG